MNKFIIIATILGCSALVSALPDGGRHHHHGGRRNSFTRGGRQDAAPISSSYGVGNGLDFAPVISDYEDNNNNGLPAYNDAFGSSSSFNTAAVTAEGENEIGSLEKSVPGVPGEDYPIYSQVPETAFSCDGQIDGGYYADPEAQCQVFHICTADGAGGLTKYSFLCPNGTVFNQQHFICDWWFNFDCSQAEALYSRNDEINAEREAIAAQQEIAASSNASPDFVDSANTVQVSNNYGFEAVVSENEAPLSTYGVARNSRRFSGRQGRRFHG